MDFQVQHWNGSSWQTAPGGSVTGNNKVWRKFTFPEVTTDKVRVSITNSQDPKGLSIVTEIEAWGMNTGPGNYSYDAAGNVTNDGAHSYVYDAENRLVATDGTLVTCAYDHQNRRVRKTTAAGTRHYVWEGSKVLAEYNGSTGAQFVNYICFGTRMIAKSESGVLHYVLSDRLSTRLLLDVSGNSVGNQGHLPFGEQLGTSGQQDKHRLTSYDRDAETELDYAINRMHSAVMGRFMQSDPCRLSKKLNSPQTFKRYVYVQNDPEIAQIDLGSTQ